MDYRLLVDLEVIAALDSFSKNLRAKLIDHFAALRSAPDEYDDYHEKDGIGRRIEISVFAGYAIHHWIDFADRQVKVLAIGPAGF